MRKIEVCVDSLSSAINAEECGVDRLEVSSCLELGGVTPSFGLVKEITKTIQAPVMVLIRPRSGNFTYSKKEQSVMLESMRSFTSLNIEGFVIGALDKNGDIDLPFITRVVELFGNASLTFHRAFDFVNDPFSALECLKKLNIKRILTSGQSDDIIKGKELIKKLEIKADNKIIIMPGGGITPKNVYELVDYTKVKEIHTSASSIINTNIEYANKNLDMGNMKNLKIFDQKKFYLIKNQLRRVKNS